MFLVFFLQRQSCDSEPGHTNPTIQDSSEVLHISQIVRVDLTIGAKGTQYFPTKACIDFRVFGEHGHRERCQTSRLGFGFGFGSVRFLGSAQVNLPNHDQLTRY